MLYLWFPNLNPLVPSFVICPLMAVLIGLLCARFRVNIFAGAFATLLLPLLFIANNRKTLLGNGDAWLLYGIIYALLAFIAFKAAGARRHK